MYSCEEFLPKNFWTHINREMNKNKLLVIFGFLIAAFFAISYLSESPQTWMDEGIIVQVARNIAGHGRHAIQIAPETFVSAGYVSTGYPVTVPVSMSLKLFGEGIIQARVMMVVFILLLVLFSYLFIRKTLSPKMALLSLFLLVSFAPLYGHGKNVLGEIPGLAYLFASVLLFFYIEKTETSSIGKKKWFVYFFAGLFFALAVVTKPIFLLLLPALVVAAFFYRKRIVQACSWKISLVFLAGLIIPAVIWLFVQFQGDSVMGMFKIYANPHNVDIASSVFANLKRFVTESQPLYTLVLFLLWCASIIRRIAQKQPVNFTETLLFFFSGLVLLAYLRTIGYYRYFFFTEWMALMYLPQSLEVLWPKKMPKMCFTVLLTLLIAFQFYQTQFSSFIAEARVSTRSHDLKVFAESIPAGDSVFVYQAPELVTFLKNDNYYQYMEVTTTIHSGSEVLPILAGGKANVVFANRDIYAAHPELFIKYGTPQNVDRYVALYPLKTSVKITKK